MKKPKKNCGTKILRKFIASLCFLGISHHSCHSYSFWRTFKSLRSGSSLLAWSSFVQRRPSGWIVIYSWFRDRHIEPIDISNWYPSDIISWCWPRFQHQRWLQRPFRAQKLAIANSGQTKWIGVELRKNRERPAHWPWNLKSGWWKVQTKIYQNDSWQLRMSQKCLTERMGLMWRFSCPPWRDRKVPKLRNPWCFDSVCLRFKKPECSKMIQDLGFCRCCDFRSTDTEDASSQCRFAERSQWESVTSCVSHCRGLAMSGTKVFPTGLPEACIGRRAGAWFWAFSGNRRHWKWRLPHCSCISSKAGGHQIRLCFVGW